MELVSIILPKTLPFPAPARAEQLGLQGGAEAWLGSAGPPPAALIEAALNESRFPHKAIPSRELGFTHLSAIMLSVPPCMWGALYEHLALAAHGSQP